MKSQFVTSGQDGFQQYLDCSLRGMATDTRGGVSAGLLADIRIMQDFAAANPERANTPRLNAWVEKVTNHSAHKPGPSNRKPTMGSGL